MDELRPFPRLPFESKVAVLAGESLAAAPGSPFPVGGGAFSLAVGDINEDGQPDVVPSSFEGDSISVLLGRQLLFRQLQRSGSSF